MKAVPVILDTRVLSGSGGGPDKTLINSPRFLDPLGYRMLCAYLHNPADPGFALLQAKARAKGVELLSIADTGPADWRVVSRAIALCRRERVAVWHGHDYKTNLLGLLVRRFYPMRLVTTAHGWVHQTRRTPIYYAIDRATLRYYERVICVSDDLLTACRKARVPASRSVLLENGVDVEEYRRGRSPVEARAALGLPQRFTIGAAGRLSPEKGFDVLIRAVEAVRKAGLDVQLLIAGEGPKMASLQSLIGELALTEHVRLVGYQADLRGLYEAMDLFALSSYREGLPNVLLEAMAMEVPVIATAVNGVPRLVAAGETGDLVDAGSVEAMADGIARLAREADRCERYATAARRFIEGNYSFARRMKRLADLYDAMGLRPEP